MAKAADIAYDKLRQLIRNGYFAEGAHLREEIAASECGLSRTPVRDALRRLESELVLERRSTGLFVRSFTDDDLSEMFDVRAMLESYAGERAAKRLNEEDYRFLDACNEKILRIAESPGPMDAAKFSTINLQFHARICEAGLNVHADMIPHVIERSIAYRRLNQMSSEAIISNYREHVAITEALRRQDGKLTHHLLSAHIRGGLYIYLESKRNSGETSTPPDAG